MRFKFKRIRNVDKWWKDGRVIIQRSLMDKIGGHQPQTLTRLMRKGLDDWKFVDIKICDGKH